MVDVPVLTWEADLGSQTVRLSIEFLNFHEEGRDELNVDNIG